MRALVNERTDFNLLVSHFVEQIAQSHRVPAAEAVLHVVGLSSDRDVVAGNNEMNSADFLQQRSWRSFRPVRHLFI